jgi:hypothetical protein
MSIMSCWLNLAYLLTPDCGLGLDMFIAEWVRSLLSLACLEAPSKLLLCRDWRERLGYEVAFIVFPVK